MSNVNFNGNIGGVQVGDNNSQTITQHNSPAVVGVKEVVAAIDKAIPDEEKGDLIPRIEAFVSMPMEKQKASESTMNSLLERVTPYAPQIGQSLAVFGEAALITLGATNPFIAGVLAICKRIASSK